MQSLQRGEIVLSVSSRGGLRLTDLLVKFVRLFAPNAALISWLSSSRTLAAVLSAATLFASSVSTQQSKLMHCKSQWVLLVTIHCRFRCLGATTSCLEPLLSRLQLVFFVSVKTP